MFSEPQEPNEASNFLKRLTRALPHNLVYIVFNLWQLLIHLRVLPSYKWSKFADVDLLRKP